jgi:hypothetical protein
MCNCESCQRALASEEREQYGELQNRSDALAREHDELESRLSTIEQESAVIKKEMQELTLGAIERRSAEAKRALLAKKEAVENI